MLKSFIHTKPRLRRSLKESHVKFFSQIETLIRTYRFGFLVTFCSYKQFFAIGTRVLVNLLHPLLNIIESDHIWTVIAQHDTLCSFVVGLRYGPESLLARSVPNLEFNVASVNIQCLNSKIDAWHKSKRNTNL